jgi:rod shape-determining protein MreB
LDEAIINHVRRRENLLIGEITAEQIKMTIGSASPPMHGNGVTMEIKGRDLIKGMPKRIIVTQRQIAEALSESVNAIVSALRVTLEATPGELSADIAEKGVILTGGGSLLTNLPQVLSDAIGLSVVIAENPLCCVALGIGHVLEHIDDLGHMLAQPAASLRRSSN